MDHAVPVAGFGRKQGENVTLTRITAVTEPTDGKLTEGVRIPEDTYALTTTTIQVSEYGRAIPFTSFAEDLSFLNLEEGIQKALRNQMERTLDSAAATAFKATKIKYALTGLASNNITTNGTFGAASTANMNLFHVEEIRDYLFDTLFAEEAPGGGYVGIFRSLGLRGIKRDPAYDQWHIYTDPQAKWNGEIGRLESIRFIESNHNKALGKVGTSSVLGEGVVFGADAVAMAEVMTPELRAAMPQDFGRSLAVAWYGIFEWGLIWDTGNAGQAKVVHVGST